MSPSEHPDNPSLTTRSEGDAASALRAIARREDIKAWLEADTPIRSVLLGAARRYIGGEDLATCLDLAIRTNAAGHAVSIDFLGESARERHVAVHAAGEFGRVISGIAERGIRGSVSFDLSHLGLLVDPGLALGLARSLATQAARAGTELMISAEGSDRTDNILAIYHQLAASHPNVGITIQAYLHRSPGDLEHILDHPGGRVRIVKGAFAEADELVLPRGAALDDRYIELAERVVRAARPLSIATHDPVVQDRLLPLLTSGGTGIELEMLHGVQPDRLASIRAREASTRTYLPYGREWFLYLTHRLAEHPPNIYTAIADVVAYGPGDTAAG